MEPYFKRFLFKVGSKPTGDYVYTKDRVSVFGALGEEDFYYETTEKYCNWKNWLKFVINLLKKYGKIVIIIDGASYHFQKKHVQNFYDYNDKNLVVFQLPPYSPELNPIEQFWEPVKEHLANTNWFTKKKFKEKLIEGLETCTKPKLYDYYLR
jgi:transposase